MRTWGVSISTKALALQLASLAVLGAVVGTVQYRLVREQLHERIEASGANLMQTLEDVLAEQPQLLAPSELGPIVYRFARRLPDVARVRVVDHTGRTVADSDPRVAARLDHSTDHAVLAVARDEQSAYINRGDQRFFSLTRPIRGRYDPARRSDLVAVMNVEMHVTPIDARIAADLTKSMLIVVSLLLILGGGIFAITRRRFVDPIVKLANAAEDFGTRGEVRHVSVETGDELEVLASAFNRMVSERRRTEDVAHTARESAEATTRAKSEFLANMSHEIRTPMNGVMGMLDLVLETELSPVQREYVDVAKSSADSLLTVIDDILDFSKVEAGRMELHAAPFSLGDTLADSMAALALRAEQKGIELALRVAPDVPHTLVGDSGRLRQIVVNLVGNAIKFTSEGEVVLRVERALADDAAKRVSSDGEEWIHVSVSDTGVGIPLEKQALIFEAFTQADSSTTRHFGGTGLGLAISSRLVAMMGGSIWVESEVGRGSTFHFRVCLAAHSGAPIEERLGDPLEVRDLAVLVVDDSATNRQILEEMLGSWSMRPTLASSAAGALATLERARQAGTNFPLLLVDAHMPEEDGFTLIERVRRTPSLAGVTIMMLSSADQAGSAARCRELGVSAYLTKPIKSSELFNAIVSSLAPNPARAAHLKARARPRIRRAKRALRVLLAEDNAINQRLAVALLERRGHSVRVVTNGQAAVDALAHDSFDVVLMDVQMPVMGGFEATALIREGERGTGRHQPVIAMTARAMAGDRERCLEAGMDAYVAKPIQSGELFAVVEGLFASDADVRDPGAVRAPRNETAILDVEGLRANIGDDDQLLRELSEIFRSEYPRMLAEVRASVATGDTRSLERAAHALKGTLGTVGGRRALAAAQDLEMMARRGSLAGADDAAALLEAEVARLDDAMTVMLAEMRNDE